MSSYVADFCQDVTTGGGVLFSTILPILALFGHSWLFFAHVCIVVYFLQAQIVWWYTKNRQISGMVLLLLLQEVWRGMPLLTIHIVAIVGPDPGKHNSLPDCVVNCAPWHCPLLGPLLFLFCFLLSIISYGQSCVTGVQNFLYQEISASSISHAGIFLARVLYSHGKV